MLEHFGSEPHDTPDAFDVPATRRYAAVCLSQAFQRRMKQLEAAVMKVRLISSRVFRDEMLRAHGIDLVEGHDGGFDGTQALTRREAARWLIAAHDKSAEYVRKAMDGIPDSKASARQALAIRELKEARSVSAADAPAGMDDVKDLTNENDRTMLRQLLERKILLVERGEEGPKLNPDEPIAIKDFEKLVMQMYAMKGDLDLSEEGYEYTAMDLAQRLKTVMDMHKADVERLGEKLKK